MAARAPSFRLESPAPARSTAAPTAPRAVPERARSPLADECRVYVALGTTVTLRDLRAIDELEQLVGDRYRGWNQEGTPAGRGPDGKWYDATTGDYAVDVVRPGVLLEDLRADGEGVGVQRFTGATLHETLAKALLAVRGQA